MKAYEHITPSDHIRFEAFTHPAYEKGDMVTVGGISGIADIAFEADAPIVLDLGSPCAVFRAARADVTGTPAVGSNIYLDNGKLTMTAGSNPVFGVITDTAGAVSFVKLGA